MTRSGIAIDDFDESRMTGKVDGKEVSWDADGVHPTDRQLDVMVNRFNSDGSPIADWSNPFY